MSANRRTEQAAATRRIEAMNNTKISKRSTMREVLEACPSAQRALFRRYHIGGCHSCGYQPEDVLEDVAHRHDIFDLDEVLGFILSADELDRRIQASPGDVVPALAGCNPQRLIDVRRPEELAVAPIAGAVLIDIQQTRLMMQ